LTNTGDIAMAKRRLIINRLELKDFLSHSNTRIEFGNGIHVFSGPNGAGKSSIVDAIYILLAQPSQVKGLRGGKKTDLIRRSKHRAEIVGWFTDELTGEEFRIKTVLSDRGNEAYLFKNGTLIATGLTSVRERLRKEFYPEGLDPESVLGNTSIIRQGGLANIARLIAGPGAGERKEYFRELLGLKEYDKAVEKIKSMGVKIPLEPPYNKVFYPLETGASGLKALEAEVQTVKSSLLGIRKEIEGMRRKLDRVEEDMKKLVMDKKAIEDRLFELEEDKRKLDQLKGQLDASKRTLGELEKSIMEKKRDIAVLKERLESTLIPEGVEEFQKEVLLPIKTVAKELELAEKELADINEKLGVVREALASTGKAERYREYSLRLRSLMDERAGLNEKLKYLRDIKKKLEEWNRLESLFLIKLEEEGIPASSLEEAKKDLANIINELNEELAKITEKISEYTRKLGAIKAMISETKEKLSLLDEDSTTCPLCGHELGPGEAEKIKKNLQSRLNSLLKEEEEVKEKLDNLADRKEEINREIKDFQRLHEEAIKLLASKPEPPSNIAASDLESAIKDYSKRITSLNEEVSRIESELKELEAYWQLYNTVKRQYVDLDKARIELESKEREVDEKIKELRNRLKELKSTLNDYVTKWNLPNDLDTLEKQVSELINTSRNIEKDKERLKQLEKELAELQERRGSARNTIRELEKQIQILSSKLQEYNKLKSRENELNDQIRKLEGLKGQLKGKLESLEKQYKELSNYLSELEKTQRKVKLLYRIRRLLEKLPSLILYETLRSLEDEMSKIIQSFNLSYTSVTVDPETLEFRVLDPNGVDVSVSQLSGGEQTAIALAFVIGLNRVLGGITGFLVLDEPTTHLDPERRRNLVEIIERSVSHESGITQLVIVTHHEEVRDAADVLCTVTKVGGTSKVECE
jgi:exonuclease SbcC